MFADKKIVALGDSITYGFPYTNKESWFDIAAQELGFDYLNQGINGDSTTWMYCRFQSDVLAHRPTHVIVMGGTNDAYCDEPAEKVHDNICQILSLAQANSVQPILGIPIPCDDPYTEQLLQEYRLQMRSYAAAQHIPALDFYSIMSNERSQIPFGLHVDGVHPSLDGYLRMSRLAISELTSILKD